MDARGAACCALSLVSAAGGLGRAPLVLAASHTEACLQSLLASKGGQQAGAAAAAYFVLRVLVHIPVPLTAPLGSRLLLDPLSRVLGSAGTAHKVLLEVAGQAEGVSSSPAVGVTGQQVSISMGGQDAAHRAQHARSTLHHLGFALGIVPWQRAYFAQIVRTAGGAGGTGGTAGHERTAADASTAAGQGRRRSLDGNGTAMELDGDLGQEKQGWLVEAMAEDQEEGQAVAAGAGPRAVQGAEQHPARNSMVAPQQDGTQWAVAAPHSAPPGIASDAGAGAGASAPLPGAVADMTVVPATPPGDPLLAAVDESACRAVVDAVRRDEFGLGLRLDGEGGRLCAVQNARMGRALQRLSAELYDKDTHFVLELVQVCDVCPPPLSYFFSSLSCIICELEHTYGLCALPGHCAWGYAACQFHHAKVAVWLTLLIHCHLPAQNADDNTYAAGVVPTLEFVLRPGSVTVLNNEVWRVTCALAHACCCARAHACSLECLVPVLYLS